SPGALMGSIASQKNIELRAKYESLLSKGKETSQADLAKNIMDLRRLVLIEGLPTDTLEGDTLRGRVWKVLLRVRDVSADDYIILVNKGATEHPGLYDKIRNDTFRTFKTNISYQKRVPENTLIRQLNAFMHLCDEDKRNNTTYVQGMNVVCAVFLYVMNELDAFYCFSKFANHYAPLYFNPQIEGAHDGVELADEVMKVADPELYLHLISKGMKTETWALAHCLSFSACTPPLDEIVKLWDFLFAFGPHVNILCLVAQIMIIREEILAAERPNLTRNFPPLDSHTIITVAVQIVRNIPDDLWKKIVQHPWKYKKSAKKFNTLPRNFKAIKPSKFGGLF
ncbi:bub2 protein, partial [Planoprotostelium fungivorum]